MSAKDQKEITRIIHELENGDAEQVSAALDASEKTPSALVVGPLIHAMHRFRHDEVRDRIHGALSTLKVSGADAAFVQALSDVRLEEIHAEIISAMWSAAIEAPAAFPIVTRLAIHGSYMVALEALTWMENLDQSPPEEYLLEATEDLARLDWKNVPADKAKLLQSIQQCIQHMRQLANEE
jgi:hypothetical protein